jgi:hypothetical protein
MDELGSALLELREMLPGKESTIEYSTNGTVLITVIDAVPFFDYQKTLFDCMEQVRAWHRAHRAVASAK